MIFTVVRIDHKMDSSYDTNTRFVRETMKTLETEMKTSDTLKHRTYQGLAGGLVDHCNR